MMINGIPGSISYVTVQSDGSALAAMLRSDRNDIHFEVRALADAIGSKGVFRRQLLVLTLSQAMPIDELNAALKADGKFTTAAPPNFLATIQNLECADGKDELRKVIPFQHLLVAPRFISDQSDPIEERCLMAAEFPGGGLGIDVHKTGHTMIANRAHMLLEPAGAR